jgi:cyclopropane fatty-acyl-phospholipid synthase-like methyltransferase
VDHGLEQELIAYYDARAREYDEVYSGKNPAIAEPELYIKEVKEIAHIVSEFGSGHVVDIGCGTGFWLPYYANNASSITLIDESEIMLKVCEQRVRVLGIADKCEFQNESFYTKKWERDRFDSALIGFFVSHISQEMEERFFTTLRNILRPHARALLIDSAWSEKRKLQRAKEGIQERILNNGRTFKIYKRYFTLQEIEGLYNKYNFNMVSSYMGTVFLTASGEKSE